MGQSKYSNISFHFRLDDILLLSIISYYSPMCPFYIVLLIVLLSLVASSCSFISPITLWNFEHKDFVLVLILRSIIVDTVGNQHWLNAWLDRYLHDRHLHQDSTLYVKVSAKQVQSVIWEGNYERISFTQYVWILTLVQIKHFGI